VAVLLASVAALAWGGTEVLMIRAARRLHPVQLGVWLMLLGSALVLPLASATSHVPSATQLPASVLPALVGLAGTFLYYLALGRGQLSIVSPTVATSGGIGALMAVVFLGERFSSFGLVGIVLAVLGVVLAASTERGSGSAAGVGWALLAAVFLGAYAVTLSFSTQAVGVAWTVAMYRITGLALLGSVALAMRLPLRLTLKEVRMVTLETTGLLAFTAALDRGPVAIVSVIMAQFSTIAVVLAAVVLHERLRRHQWVGVGIVIAATTLLAALQT
jgi:drug/metabolite transporter (DMT)-like permease